MRTLDELIGRAGALQRRWRLLGFIVAVRRKSLHSGERSTIALIVGLAAAVVAARKVVLARYAQAVAHARAALVVPVRY